MNIPFYIMISMLMVRLAFKIDVLKMEHVFQMGYKEGDKVFYVSATNWQGEETLVNSYEEGWDCHWKEANDEFEVFFIRDSNLFRFLKRKFHV
jgi:predicted ABC-class ATPase